MSVVKPNQINYSNQSQQEQKTKWTNQKPKQTQVISVKRGKTRASKPRLVWVLLSIGRKKWREIFWPITERSKAKPNQNANYFRRSIENRS